VWWVWLVAAVVLALGELLTPGLFILGPIAIAALVAMLVAAAGGGWVAQVVVFIGCSIASVAFLRPIARRHLHVPRAIRTGTAALEGAHAIVLQRVDGNGGRVRLAGEEWSARAFVPEQVMEPGTRVEVAKIEGATALVYE
jgi:membrane protein implicated in regulation of membrane protease activity